MRKRYSISREVRSTDNHKDNYCKSLALAKQNLEELERNLRITFNNSYDAIIIHTIEGQILEVNERMLKMFHLTREKALKLTIVDLSEDADSENLATNLWSRTRTDGYIVLEWSARVPEENIIFPVTAVLSRITWYGQQAVLASVRDVSQAKETERKLHESEEKYRLLFTNMLHGFALHEIIVDDNGVPCDYRYIDANPAFGRLTGWDIDGFIGKRVKDLMPDLEDYWINVFGEVAIKGGTTSFINYIKGSGKYFDTFVFSPKQGQFAVTFSDVTEKVVQKRELEQALYKLEVVREDLENRVRVRTMELETVNHELRNKVEQLELAQLELIRSEKLASLGALVSGVAHEINTPLGVSVTASSYLEVVVNEFCKDQEKLNQEMLDNFLEKIRTTSKIIQANLVRTANLVKSFKQVSVDRTNDLCRIIDVKSYLDEIILSLTPNTKKTPHKIRNLCSPGILIKSHPGAFSQIITNLIMNSIFHGFVTGESGEISLEAYSEEEVVHLIYKDNGIGIPREIMHKIYDPFFTTKRNSGGTGLGLFIVHNIVTNQLKGSIECTSVPNKETVFHIQLPMNL